MILPDKLYGFLKYFCLVALPACGTFWFTISSIYHLPYAEEVLGTISAVGTFIGVLIGVSTIQYNAMNSVKPKDDDDEV